MNLLKSKIWLKYKNKKIKYTCKNNEIYIENNSNQYGFLCLPIVKKVKNLNFKILLNGEVIDGNSAIFYLMDHKKKIINECTLNSVNYIDNFLPKRIIAAIKVLPYTKVKITKLEICYMDKPEEFLSKSNNTVLVITPSYPSNENKYLSGFVHSRLREYKKANINFDVICCHNYQGTTEYSFEGIDVLRTTFGETRKILRNKRYDKILVHFFDEKYATVFDGIDLSLTQLFFWIHGPETLYWDWPKFTSPYFDRENNLTDAQRNFCLENDKIIKRYNDMNNVTWIFVSNWIKEHSEKLINIKFENYEIIPNIIDDKIFNFVEKSSELRKKIYFLRRFDNCSKYAIDVNVRVILELSRREAFKDLEFNIYGIGDVYDKLISPIKDFPNVNLYPKFLNHSEISKIHKDNGIALFATRYDAQGVSMCEAAMSGLVTVTSKNDAIMEFLDGDYDIFSDVDDYVEYANKIEKLYNNPKLFLEYSKKCHDSIYEKCNYNMTVAKEIDLINKNIKSIDEKDFSKVDKKVLSIVVPSYNVDKFLKHGVMTMLNHENRNKIEIIIVNDGSKDNTVLVCKELMKKYNSKDNEIVKLIDKENGGHGSTINVGFSESTGKYFRIIDGDDWVDSLEFCKLIDILEKEESDIVLTNYSEDRADINQVIKKEIYNFLTPGKQYIFEDLCYENYGFNEWGPILATGNYKRETLAKTNFKLSEKSFYVDMEFNIYSVENADTVSFYPLNIYRYFIGRVNQSVSAESFRRNYKQHEKVLMKMIQYTKENDNLSEMKKKYIYDKLIIPMIKSHYLIICEYMESKKEFLKFDNKLKSYRDLYYNNKINTKYVRLQRKTKGVFLKWNKELKKFNSIIKRK